MITGRMARTEILGAHMTMIVQAISTKKELKTRLLMGGNVRIEDPALMPEWRKYGSSFLATELPVGATIVVTNHPKRSWFAEIQRTTEGFKVS